MAVYNLQNCVHDVLHGLAVVFPAMTGHDNDALSRKIEAVQLRDSKLEILIYCVAHRVDGRVAGNEHVSHDRLAPEILRVRLRGRKMKIRDIADQRPVHLLREGRVLVPRAKTGFHMADLHLVVKCRQGSGKRRGRVAVHQNKVRLLFLEDLLHAEKRLRRDRGERLPLFHDIEVKICLEVKDFHDRVQHLAVLAGQADVGFDFFAALELLDKRRHFDGLRPCAEDRHDFKFLHGSPPAKRKTHLPADWARPAYFSAPAPSRQKSRACRSHRQRKSRQLK